MSLTLKDVPAVAASATVDLRDRLVSVLGDDLVGMWLHGGTTFSDRPARPGDLDICVVVSGVQPHERSPRVWRTDPSSRPARIVAAEEAVKTANDVSLDTAYLLRNVVGKGARPSMAFHRARRENGWAVYRAHWLAGQFVPVHGVSPDRLVRPPTAGELRWALDRELEHLERHVLEGDAADPYEATYAIWNGSRILYTLETGTPVISKRSAGAWALQHLPERWHEAIRAAGRSYDGLADDRDRTVLRETMPPFVEMVRDRFPTKRSGTPRWS